jgi:pilus assembly protein CpaC
MSRFLPNSNIQAELVNDNVVLTGTVETPLDAKRAVQLAEIFVSGGEATTGQYSQTASGGDSSGGVSIDNPDSARRSSKIVNLIKIMGEDQVTLKVTVAEVSRTVMKQLGVGFLASGNSNGISWRTLAENAMGSGPVGMNQFGFATLRSTAISMPWSRPA